MHVLAALSHRDFRLLWTRQTVSHIGDAAFVVALGWRAFTLTHKASSLGIVLMVESLGLWRCKWGAGFCSAAASRSGTRVPPHMVSRVISMDWFGSVGLLRAGLGSGERSPASRRRAR